MGKESEKEYRYRETSICCCCSVAKSCPTLLWPHELQHARFPCPSLSPRVCSDSCPLSQWCYSTILSSVAPFSSSLHSFPASGSFPMSRLFPSDSQSIGASASVFPVNIQGWFFFRFDWFDLLEDQGTLTVPKHQFFDTQPSFWSNSHICARLLKNHSFDYTDLCQQSDISAL